MDLVRSLAVGALLGAVVTGGTHALADAGVVLLFGIGPVYLALGTVAAHRSEVWRVEGSVWSGLFSGVTTWGVLMLLQGTGSRPNLGVAVLGFGIAVFAMCCGALMVLDEGRGTRMRAPGTD